jgi:hypothetical protein
VGKHPAYLRICVKDMTIPSAAENHTGFITQIRGSGRRPGEAALGLTVGWAVFSLRGSTRGVSRMLLPMTGL